MSPVSSCILILHVSLGDKNLRDAFQSSVDDLNVMTTFYRGELDVPTGFVVVCSGLAMYNGFELLLLIFITFRGYAGLYFWSLLVASAGLVPYAIGFMIVFFRLTAVVAGQVISTVGWPMMVTGQSLVLYSRLSIVLGPLHKTILKAMRWTIIVNGVVFHVSTSVVFFGTFQTTGEHFSRAYTYIEKIQMTGFVIQEFILSGLYIWRTLDIIKTAPDVSYRRKRVMQQLLAINLVIIFMDIALLVIEYQNRHVLEQAVKELVYSVKLKLEFATLNKLVSIARRNDTNGELNISDDDRMNAHQKNSNIESRINAASTLANDKLNVTYVEHCSS